MWYFYVLQSQKGKNWYYKSSTNNLRRRFREHQDGQNQSTKHYRPFRLVYYEAYLTKMAVRKRETSVKKSGSVWMPLMKRVKESLDENRVI